jgi:acetyltransferase EpsM
MVAIPQNNKTHTYMKIIIVGAGGHASEIIDYLSYANHLKSSYEVLGLIDDNENNYNAYAYKQPYLGTIKAHEVNKDINYIMAIANMKYRKPIVQALEAKGAKFMTFVHPLALISPSATIGKGCVIAHNVSVGPKVVIGDYNLINSRATIGHDTRIGDYNFLSPQVVTGGFSKIGNDNFIGTNAAVLPQMQIGDNNTISAGMIVDKSVHHHETVFHRFKEKVMVINGS